MKRKAAWYLVIAALVALLITSATYLVNLPVAGYNIMGFPLPYATFHPCCSSSGNAGTGVITSYDNTYIYNTVNFVWDAAIWFAMSLPAALTFTYKRLLISTAIGTAVTLLTLLLQPIQSVYPFGGAETSLTPMGFPYEYLTYYSSGFLNFSDSGYELTLSAALADYAVWTGVTLAILGATITITRLKHHTAGFTSPSNTLKNSEFRQDFLEVDLY